MKLLCLLSVFAIAGVWSAGIHAGCVKSPNQVVIYMHTNLLDSDCKVLNVGWYSNSGSFGLPNDSISSLWVGANVRASLFEHASYKGEEAFFEGGYEYHNIGNANDKTSSIIIDYDRGTHAASWYEGNNPKNRQTFWTDNAQGMAHDYDYWYITQERVLRKWHITANLSSDRDILSVGMPPALAQRGCDHFGDPDAKNGYVFVPVTGCDNRIPLLAVFDASDLHLVCYDELYAGQADAGWLAIDPSARYLYTSDKYLSSSYPLFVYRIDWNAIYDDPNPHWILYDGFFDQHLYRRDGSPIDLAHMQGGTFSDDGKLLYLSNGYWDCSKPRDGYGLRIFDINTRQMIARSGNGYGPFNFENHCGGLDSEEVEGLDYVDMNGRGGSFGGVLHAMLLDNDATTDDDIFIKHYNK